MNPLVSVYCLAYNHEKYIRSALEGFVKQKTNFSYEVIIHDDASTDRTAEIIREYAQKYPDIIVPIIQKENQHSKKIYISRDIIYPILKGKYIACCEGDDYWIDENKLQKQVDWLERNLEYSLCVHNTTVIDMLTGKQKQVNKCKEDIDIPITDIMQGGGAHFHTSSFMFRSQYKNIPEGFRIKGVGDYPLAVYLATCGKVRYLHDIMSVYRLNVQGSYTVRLKTAPIEAIIERKKQEIKMLQYTDIYTKGEYHLYINELIRKKEFMFLLNKADKETIKSQYMDLYCTLPAKEKIKLIIKNNYPKLMNIYHKVKKKV